MKKLFIIALLLFATAAYARNLTLMAAKTTVVAPATPTTFRLTESASATTRTTEAGGSSNRRALEY